MEMNTEGDVITRIHFIGEDSGILNPEQRVTSMLAKNYGPDLVFEKA